MTPRSRAASAHQQRVDGGRVADRLVQGVHHAGQQVDDVRRDLDLVQLDAVPRRDLTGVDGIVGHGLQPLVLGPERDRVGVDLLGGPVGQHGDDAGVQAAGQEAGHRHVGDQVGGDRLLDDRGPGRAPGPAAASRATSATLPVLLHLECGHPGCSRAQEPAGSLRTPSIAQNCSGTQ